MNDATQQRMITLLAAGIAYVISHQVSERYIDIPEQRGIKDDVLEAVLKGATTATSTILASILVRRLFRSSRQFRAGDLPAHPRHATGHHPD